MYSLVWVPIWTLLDPFGLVKAWFLGLFLTYIKASFGLVWSWLVSMILFEKKFSSRKSGKTKIGSRCCCLETTHFQHSYTNRTNLTYVISRTHFLPLKRPHIFYQSVKKCFSNDQYHAQKSFDKWFLECIYINWTFHTIMLQHLNIYEQFILTS